MAALYVYTFIMLKSFPLVALAIELHGCMFLFASTSLMGAMFVLIYVPETKGKSFEEIGRMLEGKPRS